LRIGQQLKKGLQDKDRSPSTAGEDKAREAEVE